MRSSLGFAAVCLGCQILGSARADWPQWRGPDQTGFVESEPLLRELPPDGLQPLWKLEPFAGGDSGGWGSPVIADGYVYLYAHTKQKKSDVQLGQPKYPWLPPEKRAGMSDEEYEQYEANRRDENQRRAEGYRIEERLVCLSLESGEPRWERSLDSVYTQFTHSGTPCVAGDRVLVLSPGRIASCFDAATGETRWTKRLPGEFRDEYFSSSFAVTGDTALITCGPLFALSIDDGEIRWQGETPLDYASHSSPVVWQSDEGAVAIVNTQGAKTEAYRVSDGKKLWTLNSGASHSTPIVAGDRLLTYGGSRKQGLRAYALNRTAPEQEPEPVWNFQRAADQGSTPVVRGEHVFVQGEKRIAKVDLESGKSQWQATLQVSNPRYTSLIAAGDQVLYGWEGLLAFDATADDFEPLYDAEVTSDGRLIGSEDLRRELGLDKLSADSGDLAKAEKTWQQEAVRSGPLPCATPAVADGKIVLRLRNAVVCFDMTPPSPR